MQNHHPNVFGSHKLKDYERHYTVYGKEMLTIMHALAKFRQYLLWNKLKVKTDHNGLWLLM